MIRTKITQTELDVLKKRLEKSNLSIQGHLLEKFDLESDVERYKQSTKSYQENLFKIPMWIRKIYKAE